MFYAEEYRPDNVYELGFEDRSVFAVVNSVGYYATDEIAGAKPLEIFRPHGRKDYLLCYVSDGVIRVKLGKTYNDVSNGVFFYPPMIQQSYHSTNTTGALTIYWIHFSGYGIAEIMHQCGIQGKGTFATGNSPEIESIFKKLMEEMRIKRYGHEIVTASLTATLMAKVARLANESLNSENARDARITAILNHIHANYHQNLDIGTLASLVNLSPSRLSSLFNECVGMYPKAYLTHYRIERACAMLKNTTFSIAQITYFTGYDDPLYFSRLFRKYMNVSPSQYAERARQDGSEMI